MEMASAFTLNVRLDNIAVITIDVPGEKMNTLKAEFASQVRAIIKQLRENKELRGVVFVSAKPDNFIAGADINMIGNCKTAQEAEALARQGQQLMAEIHALPIQVIAAIHGACLGGGLELALACHGRSSGIFLDKFEIAMPCRIDMQLAHLGTNPIFVGKCFVYRRAQGGIEFEQRIGLWLVGNHGVTTILWTVRLVPSLRTATYNPSERAGAKAVEAPCGRRQRCTSRPTESYNTSNVSRSMGDGKRNCPPAYRIDGRGWENASESILPWASNAA